jgi:hypothetical protein
MIKRKNFLLSLLLLPYLVWPLLYVIGIPVVLLGGDFAPFGEALVAAVGITAVYTFGIVIWGVPYTLFAISFLFWSKNKSIKKTYSALIGSPLILAFIAVAVVMIIGLFHRFSPGKVPLLADWQNLGLISLHGAVLCLVYGYILVGIGIVGYRLFDHLKFFKSESETPQSMSGLDTIPSGNNFKNGAS